ncbi:tetratricopeptide repeat protein [Sphingomonas sp.]|uniref:tetratricopeptide repeat protein n=1 Tax=Sphingomonas sp. TaxID=28214 RepID=UPI003D6D169C
MNGSVAFTPAKTEDNRGSIYRDEDPFSPSVILYHEYGHHFMLGNFAAAYPSWFTEGYAEVVSTATFHNNQVTIGAPANHRAYTLFHGKALPIEELLGSAQQRMTGEQVDDLYARGWLMTHYLMFNDARAAKFTTYINLLNNGTPSIDAARTAFGDLKELDRDLGRYLSTRLPGKVITLTPEQMPKIDIKPLSEGASAMMAARMQSARGGDKEKALRVFVQGKEVAERYPDDPVVQTWLAEMAYDAGDDPASEAAADRALAKDPKTANAMLYKARVLMRRATKDKAAADDKAWTTARSWIVKANRADPDSAAALALFYTCFLEQGLAPSESAILGLQKAFDLVPQDEELRFLVARQDINDGNPLLARRTLAPLAYNPHAPRDNPAARLIADLTAGKSGPDALAAFDAAVKKQAEADAAKEKRP